ncbi:MAG: nuclear transport factor 2 family protein [Alphaproteobacteria bacterium]|nr:nuclear transport factor 2 family protein [Alphaproteobacteria bacterium]
MNTASDRQAIRDTLDRFIERCRARDAAIAEDFAEDALLLGSEADEIVRGRAAIHAHFATIFRQPYVIKFGFGAVDVTVSGDVGWFHAEGVARLAQDGRDRSLPYRLTGVVRRAVSGWHWTLFHGSEPSQGRNG